MSSKALRILIADKQHFHCMAIERNLNLHGYYRIAPVHCLDELLSIVEYSGEPFDLVIINAILCSESGLDPVAFCQDNQQILHALICEAEQAGLPALLAAHTRNVWINQARIPSLKTLEGLMSQVTGAFVTEAKC